MYLQAGYMTGPTSTGSRRAHPEEEVAVAASPLGVARVVWPLAVRERCRSRAEAQLGNNKLSDALLRAVILFASLPAPHNGSRAQEIRAGSHRRHLILAVTHALMVLVSLPLDGSYMQESELYWALGISQRSVQRVIRTLLVLGVIERRDPASNFYRLA